MSTETPAKLVPSFDQVVTQWMSPSYSDCGSRCRSCHVHVCGFVDQAVDGHRPAVGVEARRRLGGEHRPVRTDVVLSRWQARVASAMCTSDESARGHAAHYWLFDHGTSGDAVEVHVAEYPSLLLGGEPQPVGREVVGRAGRPAELGDADDPRERHHSTSSMFLQRLRPHRREHPATSAPDTPGMSVAGSQA